jgi:hypothetical protein
MTDGTGGEGLQVQTAAEMMADAERDREAMSRECDAGTKRWGNWRYNPSEPPSLDHGGYQIVLARLDSTAKLGDWLLHLSEKNWVTADDLGQLVKAVGDLNDIGYLAVSGRGVA